MRCSIVPIAAVLFIGTLFTGCETYKPYSSSGFDPSKLKRVAIAENPQSKTAHHSAGDIETNLMQRGVSVTIVSDQVAPPQDVDGYFTYQSHWQWDLTMYLAKLEIELHDPRTAQLLASARYEQGLMHRYPDRNEIVDALIAQIFGEPPPKHRRGPENHE